MNFFFFSENIRSIERDKFYYKVQDAKQSLKMNIISTSGYYYLYRSSKINYLKDKKNFGEIRCKNGC